MTTSKKKKVFDLTQRLHKPKSKPVLTPSPAKYTQHSKAALASSRNLVFSLSSVKQAPKSGVKGLLTLMGVIGSPASKKFVLDNNAVMKEMASQTLFFSTPERGLKTSFIQTPAGSQLALSRMIEHNGSQIGVFLSRHKTLDSSIQLNAPNSAFISPVPSASMQDIVDHRITLDGIYLHAGKGRHVTQIQLAKISAAKALEAMGTQTPKGLMQWLHRGPSHGLAGIEVHNLANLGIGTKFANAEMELVNPVIRKLLEIHKDTVRALYVSSYCKWVPGFENIRLLESIEYEIKDGPGTSFNHKVTFKFNALTTRRLCESEIDMIKDLIIEKFTTVATSNTQAQKQRPQIVPKKLF